MRTKRAIIISAILALGATGSILAGSAMPAAAAQAPSAHAVSVVSFTPQGFYYHG